jgi:hypothetical protein
MVLHKKVYEETDDGVVIYFSCTQYSKVLEWVLSRGCTE